MLLLECGTGFHASMICCWNLYKNESYYWVYYSSASWFEFAYCPYPYYFFIFFYSALSLNILIFLNTKNVYKQVINELNKLNFVRIDIMIFEAKDWEYHRTSVLVYMVRIPDSHSGGPGSIPGYGTIFYF